MSARKFLLPIIPIAGFFILWQILAVKGILNPGIFPSPTAIFREMLALWSEQVDGRSVLLAHLLITLKRLFLASVYGILAGIAVGFLMGLSQSFYRFLDPLITIIMPIPGIAMAPLFIIWMGFGDSTIITVCAVATFFPVAYNTCTGVRSMDHRLVQAAYIMGANRRTVLTQVYGPWSAVYAFTGIKLGLARCWRTVIAVEFIVAANRGLGYMIWDAASYLRSSVVFGGIILTALIFVSIEKGMIRPLERLTIEKWGMVRN
jgi:ABC-type nitrate/sulfonate/bicarbonate transport system permease component